MPKYVFIFIIIAIVTVTGQEKGQLLLLGRSPPCKDSVVGKSLRLGRITETSVNMGRHETRVVVRWELDKRKQTANGSMIPVQAACRRDKHGCHGPRPQGRYHSGV